MTQITSCPAMPELELLAEQRMPADQAQAIMHHLEQCSKCNQLFQMLGNWEDTGPTVAQVSTPPGISLDGPSGTAVILPPSPAGEVARPNDSDTAAIHPISSRLMPLPATPPRPCTPYAFLTSPQSPDELGRLAHYRVLNVLGEGGMGVVFQAEDTKLQRSVALKVMKPSCSSLDGKERFIREARAVAALKHDHIVTVYQVGEEGQAAYMAMEFLEGQSLKAWMEKPRTPTAAQLMRLAREMAGGLAAAHQRGLIHRDIKPANIWLEAPTGRVKILDFGLARTAKDDTHLTQQGLILGTPAFMSPEQARSEPVDERSDLFSLGIVLYRVCSGEAPFQGDTSMAILLALANELPKPLHELNPSLPPAFAALIMQLLAKQPENRPASAKEVVNTIKAIEREIDRTGPMEPVPTAVPMAEPIPEAAPASASMGPDWSALEASRRTLKPVALPPTARVVPEVDQRRRLILMAGAGLVFFVLAVGIIWGMISALSPSSTRLTPFARNTGSTSERTNSPKVTSSKHAKTRSTMPKPPPVAKGNGKLPVKVFLLAGQSNMGGVAAVRTLDGLASTKDHAHLLKRIKNPDGSWVVRNDVWVYNDRLKGGAKKGPLTVGFGERNNTVGPELMFGTVMGDYYENQVLLIKICQGPMSLAVEGRPPSSGGGGGQFYHRMTRAVQDVVGNLKKHFPEYQDQGYEIAGFVWFQAWNDMIMADRVAEYETNLVNLIKDIRQDLKAPKLPVVIGELGIPGDGRQDAFRRAQAAPAKRPEFKGTVAFVPTVKYWDKQADELLKKGYIRRKWVDEQTKQAFEKIGSNPRFLYLGSGRNISMIGNAMAEGMKNLCPKEY